MKSILFYISRYPGYGGIEKVTTYLANYWSNSFNWNIHILSLEQQDLSLLNLLSKNVTFHTIPEPKELLHKKNLDCINQIIDENKIEYIIYQDSYVNSHYLLKYLHNPPSIIVVEHNMPNCSIAQYKFLWHNIKPNNIKNIIAKCLYPYYLLITNIRIKKYHTELYNLSNIYVLLSKEYIPIFKEITSLSDYSKLTWINNPVTNDIITFKKVPKAKNIIFIGRLDLQKGVILLLQIWSQIEKNFPDWKLTIIGDGPQHIEVDQFINKNKLKQIRVLGFQKNINYYLDQSSILCMTSIFEGWPLVLFEAMARGVVPISFNSFMTAKEIIKDNYNGYIIPPFDTNLFVKRLAGLMNNPKDLIEKSNNALTTIKNYSIENISKKWETLLK